MPLLCAIAIVRPEMKVIRGDSSVLLPRSSLQSAQASKNYNLILFRTILHPPDSFVSKMRGWLRCEPPVVEDQKLDTGEALEEPYIASIAACQRQGVEQARHAMVEHRSIVTACL